MMKISGILAVVFIATAADPVYAHADGYGKCVTDARGNVSTLASCNYAEVTVRDVVLNQVYTQLMNAIGSQRRIALRSAERAWVSFRDPECNFRAFPEIGKDDAPFVYSTCQLELTNERIDRLNHATKAVK